MKISEITQKNTIALWLGHISDFADLDAYIWEHFEQDFGIQFEERSAPEIDAHELPVAVESIIDGFSFSSQWSANAVKLCTKAGWKTANCAVVLYHVRYPEELQKNNGHPLLLSFIGNIEWTVEQ